MEPINNTPIAVNVQKKRERGLDIVAGILIMAMVFSHMILSYVKYKDPVIYPLFQHTLEMLIVPWFFYKSGMFFKYGTIKEIAMGGARKLLVPYVVFLFVAFLFRLFLNIIQPEVFSISGFLFSTFSELFWCCYLQENLPIWFLLSLFLVWLLFGYSQRYKIHPLFVALLCFIGQVIQYYITFKLPIIFPNVLSGLLFFSLGSYLKKIQYSNCCLIFCIIVFLIIDFFAYYHVAYFRDTYSTPLPVLFSLSGIIMLNNLARRFSEKKLLLLFSIIFIVVIICASYSYFYIHNERFTANSMITVFLSLACVLFYFLSAYNLFPKKYDVEGIGHYSMIIFICHWPVFYFANLVCSFWDLTSLYWQFTICCITESLFMPLFIYFFTSTRMKKVLGFS